MSAEAALAAARAAFANGDFGAALAHARGALALGAQTAEAHALAVNAALKLQRWSEAVPHLEHLVAADPAHAQFRRLLGACRMRVGNALRDAGAAAEARAAYLAALEADPGADDARYNLALLEIEDGTFDRAATLLRVVVSANPDDAEATLQLVRAEAGAGRTDAARAAIERADAPPGAVDPRRAAAVAGAWRMHGELEAANALLDAVGARVTGEAERLTIAIGRALGVPSVYRDIAHLDATRIAFARGLDALIADYPPARIARIDGAIDALQWDNFYLAYQGEDDRALQERFGAWLAASLAAALPLRTPDGPAPRRIAVVGSFFRDSTVGSYFHAWIGALEAAGIETTVFQLGPVFDDRTEDFARSAGGRLVRLGSDLVANAARIREARPRMVLYPELGMDARVLALAALRLAPVQACAWGHPVTSGLPTIDVFLSCAEMEPVLADAHYVETLLPLPGLGTRYASPQLPAPASRTELGLPAAGRTLYLVPQSPFKLHPDNDAVLIDVARRDPHALLVLFDGPSRPATRVLRDRLARAFTAAGLDFAHHVVVRRQASRAEYLRVNQACDVMIDSLRWSGGNTSLDALHAGLPVVTCPGALMRGRQSMAMLARLGCAELIVDTPERLAVLAVELANDRPRREALAARIAAALPGLVDDPAPLEALVAAMESLL